MYIYIEICETLFYSYCVVVITFVVRFPQNKLNESRNRCATHLLGIYRVTLRAILLNFIFSQPCLGLGSVVGVDLAERRISNDAHVA